MKKKNKQLNIRVSEQALNKIKDNAQRLEMSQTEYFEMIAVNGIIELVEVNNLNLNSDLDKILKSLDKIGNNLNQLAKKLNSGGKEDNADNTNFINMNKSFNTLYDVIEKKSERKIIFKNGGK